MTNLGIRQGQVFPRVHYSKKKLTREDYARPGVAVDFEITQISIACTVTTGGLHYR
jgi:hypothetical protein